MHSCNNSPGEGEAGGEVQSHLLLQNKHEGAACDAGKLWVTTGVSCQTERIQSHLRNKLPGGPGRNYVDLVHRGERTHPAGGQNSSSWGPGLQEKEE